MKKNNALSRVSKCSILSMMVASALSISCQEKLDGPKTTTNSNQRYLYFASGACYVGNYTGSRPATTTASGLVNRITLDTAQAQGTAIVDYNPLGVNFWPNGISDFDSSYLLAAVSSSTTGIRIDKISKSTLQDKQDYVFDLTNLNGLLKKISLTSDGSILVLKTSGVEKYNSARNRVMNATATAAFAVIPTTGSSCSSTTTTLSAILSLPNNMVFFANANIGFTKVGVLGASGYSATTDCLGAISFSGTSSPAAAAQPTSAVVIPGTDPYQVLVATASTTAGNDQIWLFTVNSSSGAITFVKSLYNDTAYLRGISAMTYDTTDGYLYVANGSTLSANTIEKLSYNSTSQTLTRVSTFFSANAETQCVNSMFVGN